MNYFYFCFGLCLWVRISQKATAFLKVVTKVLKIKVFFFKCKKLGGSNFREN